MAARETFKKEVEIIPDPLQPAFRILFRRDNKTGTTAIYQTKNGGETYEILLPVPGPNDRVGSVATLTSTGIKWELPSTGTSNANATSAASGGTGILQFIDMYLGNQIFSGAVFGYFRVPAGYSFRCREVQITAMTVPDTNVVLDFIDSNGLPVSNTVALPALSRAKSNILTSPLLMAASSSWAMKVLSCGTEAPGENLNARLVLELQS